MQLTGLAVAFSILLPSVVLAQGWVDRTGLNNPPPRYGHGMAYDPVRGYTVMAGGHTGMGALSDTWTWDGAHWALNIAQWPTITNASDWGTSLCFDPISGMVIGAVQSGAGWPTYWSLYCWNGTQWINMNYSTTGAGNATMAFDHHRQELLLYFCHFSGGDTRIHTWNGSHWTSRSCPSVPSWSTASAFMAPSLVWEPSVGRVVLNGGDDFNGNMGSRTYEWTGFNWLQRFPPTRPLVPGATTTDSIAGCAVMFDGNTLGQGSQAPGHTWTIRNGTFQRIFSTIEPMLRLNTAMTYDSARGVTVLFGGRSNPFNSTFSDTWELTLGAPASYTPFGGGCPGSRGVPQLAAQGGSTPRIGATFTAQANNLPWTGLVFLYLGLSDTSYAGTPLPANLGFLGAPACNLLCSGDEVYILPNALGATSWSFQVPPYPGLSFYNQILALDPTANPLGLTLSNAARGVIGL